MSEMPPSIAATSTLAMVRTAEARGVPTADLLERAGISVTSLEDPDFRIPAPTALSLWDALRERAGDPALQLAAPVSLPFGAYRVIDYLVAASATVGEGVTRFARFFGLIADTVALNVVEEGGDHGLCLDTRDGSPVPPVYVDYVFAALVQRIRMRIRPALALHAVDLRRPGPPNASVYGEAFQAPVRFAAAADCVWFADAEWKAPMDSADEALASLMDDYAQLLSGRSTDLESGFTVEVAKAVATTLPEGGSATTVARALHMSVRTLQRKLVASGTTFRDLSDTVRSNLAQGYLADPNVSSAEVAFLLGFSDPSSFTRAFRRWTGVSPRRWRQGGP